MTKQTEALKLALEATLEALRFSLHVGFDESSESQIKKADKAVQQHQKAITALQEALASEAKEQPAQQWNAGVPSLYPEPEPGVSIKATYEQPAQPQEPVAWRHDMGEENGGWEYFEEASCPECQPLYTSPPAQRKPLTPEWYAQWIRNNYQDYGNIATLCDEMTKAAHGIKENT